tara:strand:- start:251 stop:703 length:453 start_codon:yes stop_codon:yes gene_type:complete
MKYYSFLFINFVVSFLSDIVLNDLSRGKKPIEFSSKIIKSLDIYFENKSIIIAGILAGLTVVISLFLTTLISNLILGFSIPKNIIQLLKFCVLSFVLGFIIDILIDKVDLFGKTLRPYYKIAGSGLWGGLAFIFSIIISYIIQKHLLPIL